MRWIVAGLVALALLLGGGWVWVGQQDFAGLAESRLSARLGRPVEIGSLTITPGRWLAVSLRDARLANAPGVGPEPMAQLASLEGEVDLFSLLAGPPVLRNLRLSGARVALERGADGAGNWRFGAPDSGSSGGTQRAEMPATLGMALAESEITYRTSSGALLRIRLDRVSVQTGSVAEPVRLLAEGAYNDVPITLEGDLASLAVLRDAAQPYPADLRFRSGETDLRFQGTIAEPLALDGAAGQLTLDARSPDALLAIAGVESRPDAALFLQGPFEHRGQLWQMTQASGKLGGEELRAPLLRLEEGARGQPDRVTVEVDFTRLDLDALLREKGGRQEGGADMPIAMARAPDTLGRVVLTADTLLYAGIAAEKIRFEATAEARTLTVQAISLTYTGARIAAQGKVEGVEGQERGRVTAQVDVSGLEVQALRRLLGIGTLPMQGPMNGQFAVRGEGRTLNEAARTGHASAVVEMRGGSISRRMLEIASTDIRSVFRRAEGMSPIGCLVGVLDMRGGAGTVSPLRVRAREGTITGSGRFDLFRRQVDLTISSETPSSFALDIPVRVSGAFADPSIRPAQWSAEGRAQLAASDNVNALLPALRPFARRNPCLSSH